MKTHTYLIAATLAVAIWLPGRSVAADEMPDAAREAQLILAEIDQDILTEQYRNVQMKSFEARMELRLTQIKLRHAPEAERDSHGAKQMLTALEERVEMLERVVHELRERFIDLHLEWAELEGAHSHAHEHEGEARHEPVNKLDGIWVGHAQGRDALIRLRVDGDRAQFEGTEESDRFEGTLVMEPEGEELWEVQFHIEKCRKPEYQGKISLGLARVAEDRFVLAANEPGNPDRPSSLEPTDETRVFVFERE